MNENKKSKRILKILPWYMGLSYGLLFYTPISTLFFTIAKNLSPSQITLLGTISTLLCILLQPSLLKIIKKINNVLSVRIGSILLLLSVLLITFGNFYMIMIGIILETIAFTFKDMINIILRNNLIYAFKSDEYIKYKNKSFLIYSIATATIALVVGYLFNLNYYIPMICCMICCTIIIIMSLFIDDIKTENVEEKSNNSYSKIIIKNKMIINIILFFGLIRTCIALGFNNSELFIQQELKYFFNIAKTTYYFSLIVFVSRIVRILSNLCLNKIYLKLREKFLLIKFLIMCLSYSIVVALIDFFTSVIQDTVLDKTSSSEQQAALTYLSLSYKVFKVIFGCFVSLILLRYSLVYVLIFLVVLILVGMIFFSETYKKLIK